MGNFQIWTRLTFLDDHRKLPSQATANNWTVPDDILSMSILSGLPPSWSPWIEATTSHYHLLNKPLTSKDMSEGILQCSRTLLVRNDGAEAKGDGEGKVMKISGGNTTSGGRPRCSPRVATQSRHSTLLLTPGSHILRSHLATAPPTSLIVALLSPSPRHHADLGDPVCGAM
jgi:hypothetical protein